MPYNEYLAKRIRASLKLFPEDFTEKKMFGGLAFLFNGKMTVGIIKNELIVRVIENKMGFELQKPYTRPMDFTKKTLKEFIFVKSEEIKTEEKLLYYIELGLEHAKSKLKKI